MVRHNVAVIGSNYGDEGKGLMTSYFSSLPGKTLIIRFNGGANAGHTVVTPQKTHIFQHLGSGSLHGADTYLGPEFILNPTLFVEELKRFGIYNLKLYIHPNCKVSTPYDMMANVAREENRKEDKHGSCAAGINETVVRYQHPHAYYFNLWDNNLPASIQHVRNYHASNLRNPTPKLLLSEGVYKRYLKDLETLRAYATPSTEIDWGEYDRVVYEGAQGLLLDQNRMEFFPYLTRSNTGLQNISAIHGPAPLDVVYVTRTYLTRHGPGPLANELQEPLPGMECKTNVTNRHQGALRYAPLELNLLRDSINQDIAKYSKGSYNIQLAITHTDALYPEVPYFIGKEARSSKYPLFPSIVKRYLDIETIYKCYGPTTQDITLAYAPKDHRPW